MGAPRPGDDPPSGTTAVVPNHWRRMGLIRTFKKLSLSVKLIASYLVILGVGGLAITVVGSYIVSSTIMAEAERTVKHDLAIARAIYQQEIRVLQRTVEVAAAGITIPELLEARDTLRLLDYLQDIRGHDRMDFLTLAGAGGRVLLRTSASPVRDDDARVLGAVASSLRERRSVAGTEVLSAAQLERENPVLREQARIPLFSPGRTQQPSADELTTGLVLTAAAPVRDAAGRVVAVLYAGHLVNHNDHIVDTVWHELYLEESQRNGGTGTVTIFLGDVRISTNVRTHGGARALGTRVSEEVRRTVLERGEAWNGRAYVLDARYITAYEPIRSVAGDIVGMLYVGLPEASYAATRNNVIISFLGIATIGFLLVLGVTYLGIQRMTRPLGQMVEATRSIAAGDFDHEVDVDEDSEGEIARLAGSFNLMLQSLRDMRGDLEEWGRTLEEKVRERTDELVKMQTRVAQSERLASIGMLAAGVAHEVNNPLGGVLALTALTLEDLPEDDPNRENLEEVVRQTERCRDIVKHLLEFSRQTDVSTDELDLNEVADKTLSLLRRQSLFFNIEIRKELDPELPRILGDPSQLQQVFMNILMNAVEAMEESGVLTLRTRRVADGEGAEVQIGDTGCGIPQEHLHRIFDPFFTTGKDGQGTGLGLSIAYGIITKHRGAISVESEVGVGTTFTIRLPAAGVVGAEPEPAEPPQWSTVS
jgi:two-component system, NtrC family, sensor kinase